MTFLTYKSDDIEEIKKLVTQTFSDSEGPAEGALIGNLAYDLMTTTATRDLYCFVAVENDEIIGSIFFSRLSFENSENVFVLGPVAVHTNFQRKGIGQQLINFGLSALKTNGVELAITYGDPAFYVKVGFAPITEDVVKAPLKLTYPEGWLAQSLVGDKVEPLAGKPYCVAAFNKPEFW